MAPNWKLSTDSRWMGDVQRWIYNMHTGTTYDKTAGEANLVSRNVVPLQQRPNVAQASSCCCKRVRLSISGSISVVLVRIINYTLLQELWC